MRPQILNLADIEKSDIKYTIDKFPDGQVNIHINGINLKNGVVDIICRISNNDDLVLLMMVNDVLKRQGVIVNTMFILYLLCGRMDRVMSIDQPYSLNIVADVVNSFNASVVGILEPHSDKARMLIKNSVGKYPLLKYIDETTKFVFPDEGAAKRYGSMKKINDPIICTKKRDPQTNELSDFGFVNSNPNFEGSSTYVVLDDLCDGGGTFMGIGKLIKESVPSNCKLILKVTHMIQPKIALPKLLTIYDEVWFTNSYNDWNKIIDLNTFEDCSLLDHIKIIDVIPNLPLEK